MSTAEMSMTTNSARALIDARLEAVERALFGRLSRSERHDIVGEVESRIDELLRELCGPDSDPSREDVLAVLARLDPPEAYLDLESGEGLRQPEIERKVRTERSTTASISNEHEKFSLFSGICGIVGLLAALAAPVIYFLASQLNSEFLFLAGCGLCGLTSMTAGTAALVFAGVSRLKTTWSIAGLLLGVVTIMMPMMTAACMFLL